MATAEQIKSLIRSHFSNEKDRFNTIALQVAAHEAKQGHSALANDIRILLDNGKKKNKANVIKFPLDLKNLVLTETPDIRKSQLVICNELEGRLNNIIHEYQQIEKLKSFGLENRRKILLIGPPGTGKTMTAKALANELKLPLHTIQVDRLVTKFMGETSSKLRQIFDLIESEQGVYFFDEFDAIGGERSMDNDVGEMRRVLNSFLQFIEQDASNSIIIGATNNPKLLDHALFRRFDDILYYTNPNKKERKELILNLLGNFIHSKFTWKSVIEKSDGLSQSELDQACRNAIKSVVLSNSKKVTSEILEIAINNKQASKQRYTI